MTESNAPTAPTDLSLLLGLSPAPKAIPPGRESVQAQAPLSGYGTGRLAILSRLHQHPDQVFNAKDLALSTNLEISVVHKHLRGLAESGLISCTRKGNARTLALYQASSHPPAYVLELALKQANAELGALKARAVDLVLSCEPDEPGRLSLESIAQTLEDNL